MSAALYIDPIKTWQPMDAGPARGEPPLAWAIRVLRNLSSADYDPYERKFFIDEQFSPYRENYAAAVAKTHADWLREERERQAHLREIFGPLVLEIRRDFMKSITRRRQRSPTKRKKAARARCGYKRRQKL